MQSSSLSKWVWLCNREPIILPHWTWSSLFRRFLYTDSLPSQLNLSLAKELSAAIASNPKLSHLHELCQAFINSNNLKQRMCVSGNTSVYCILLPVSRWGRGSCTDFKKPFLNVPSSFFFSFLSFLLHFYLSPSSVSPLLSSTSLFSLHPLPYIPLLLPLTSPAFPFPGLIGLVDDIQSTMEYAKHMIDNTEMANPAKITYAIKQLAKEAVVGMLTVHCKVITKAHSFLYPFF